MWALCFVVYWTHLKDAYLAFSIRPTVKAFKTLFNSCPHPTIPVKSIFLQPFLVSSFQVFLLVRHWLTVPLRLNWRRENSRNRTKVRVCCVFCRNAVAHKNVPLNEWCWLLPSTKLSVTIATLNTCHLHHVMHGSSKKLPPQCEEVCNLSGGQSTFQRHDIETPLRVVGLDINWEGTFSWQWLVDYNTDKSIRHYFI